MSFGDVSAEVVTVRVPIQLVKRGGRKEVHLPDRPVYKTKPDDAIIYALARACRWKRMLETGAASTMADIARREGIASSYVARLLQLTLLAPEIVEAILDGAPKLDLTTEALKSSIPDAWYEQRALFRPEN